MLIEDLLHRIEDRVSSILGEYTKEAWEMGVEHGIEEAEFLIEGFITDERLKIAAREKIKKMKDKIRSGFDDENGDGAAGR